MCGINIEGRKTHRNRKSQLLSMTASFLVMLDRRKCPCA